jgi:hypothetical protein
MSDVMYPISLIREINIERMDRTLSDEFDDGSTNVRRYWDAQEFKRRLTLVHGHLTPQEFRYLRSFNSQREGRYDSFWFRDNIQRGGNMKVRFASPLPAPWSGGARQIQVSLEEVAPIRALPEFDELATAAGATPLFWYDANREIYLNHMGTVTMEGSFYDSQAGASGAVLQAGTFPLANHLSQYQHYGFDGTAWGKTAANLSGLSGSQPACTVFAIAKHGTIASKQVLFGVGTMGAGAAVGIAISASNAYEPWIGGSETWGTATQSNGTNNTWRSLCVTWAAASNTANFYVNGAAALTESETRSYSAGPVSLGAAVDGSLKNVGNVAHCLAFAGQLTFAQVKAVHNLLGYQYGLATL